jgi:hypothetical protein
VGTLVATAPCPKPPSLKPPAASSSLLFSWPVLQDRCGRVVEPSTDGAMRMKVAQVFASAIHRLAGFRDRACEVRVRSPSV